MTGSRATGVPGSIAALALAALTAIGASRTAHAPVSIFWLSIVVLGVSGVLVWRAATGWRLVAGLTVPVVAVTLACYGDPRNLGWFGLCIVAGWVALETSPPIAFATNTVLAAVFAMQFVAVSSEPGWITWIAGIAFTTGACVFARRQRVLVERLHRAQAELAQRARDDERQRIAREMHDLVGHRLTVTVLHLGSARLALDDDLSTARSSLAAAEQAARDSLDDVRTAVGLMRHDSPSGPAVPTAASFLDLVESYRSAGAGVDLELCGDLDALTANRSLAAFRILQESLTNAVRHGDGGPIRARIDVIGGRVQIVVRNAVQPRAPEGAGTGIAAMGERAGALGGHLTARPDPGGWLVEAVIPG